MESINMQLPQAFDSPLRPENILRTAVSYEELSDVQPLQNDSNISRPIFVIGSPRSGTTLLGKCLSAHHEVVGDNESIFLLHLCDIFRNLHQRGLASLRNFVSSKELLLHMQHFASQIFSSLQKKHDDKKNDARYLDHTPWYGAITPFIDLLYPDASYIHIARDGRSVVQSLERSYQGGHYWAGRSISEQTRLWASMVLCCRRAQANPSRYCEVTYEDFMGDPKKQLEIILSHLGIRFCEDMLHPLLSNHAGGVKDNVLLPSDPRMKGEQGVKPQISWPNVWSDKDKSDFIRIAGQVMDDLFGISWRTEQNG